jgi:non-ribosomal peptide synthetase component F
VLLQCAPVCWDGFPLELFGALLFGATCVLPLDRRSRQVAALVAEHRVALLQLPAGLLGVLADQHPEIFDTVRQVLTRGEPAPVGDLAGLLARHPRYRSAGRSRTSGSTCWTTGSSRCRWARSASSTPPASGWRTAI